MHIKASRAVSRFFQSNNNFRLMNSIRYGFGYSVGSDFDDSIKVCTSRNLRDMAEKFPSNIFINSYDQNQQLTYQQVLKQAEQLATGLLKTYNLKPKDRIGLYAYNKS
jgi:non-ribosomal peptide synthetase component F